MAADRLVVAAIILNDSAEPTHVLAAQRSYPADLRGLWEFPGGKVEPDEEPETALRREINEELTISLSLGREFINPNAATRPGTPTWPIAPGYVMRLWVATRCRPITPEDQGHGSSSGFSIGAEPARQAERTLPQAPAPGDSHLQLRWVPINSLDSIPWLPGDTDIVRHLPQFLSCMSSWRPAEGG